MSINCKILLKGNIGSEPKRIKPENGKEFVVLSVATADSYKDANGVWQKKQTAWHEVIFFKSTVAKFPSELKKGDHVIIEGTLSYKPAESKEGFKINQAAIIGTYVAKAPFSPTSKAE